MTLFIVAAVLLVGTALLFVVPPLLRRNALDQSVERKALNISVYRDQLTELERDLQNDVLTREQYLQGRQEIERRLLDDVAHVPEEPAVPAQPQAARASAVALMVLIPLLSVGVYLKLGEPEVISRQPAAAPAAGGTGDMVHQISQMISQLEQRLAADPGNAEGWAMLGRSYLVIERFDEARAALEKAVAMNLQAPELLVDYADVLAMTGGRSLEGRPLELIGQALALDPYNQKGLWLAGTAAYERGDYRSALEYWHRLYAIVPKGSEAARAMEGNIAEAEKLLAAGGATAPRQPAAAGGAAVRGTVSLDQALRARVRDSDTVFVFAQALDGSRMPLAMMRAQVKDLPLRYTLDDSTAMDPSLSLSHFSEVVVVARISRGGSAAPQSGDLQGRSAVIPTSATAAADVLISEVLP